MKNAIIFILSLIAMISCDEYKSDFNSAIGSSLEIHHNNEKKTLSNEELQYIKKWFETNQNGWSSSISTYAPKKMIRNESININITQNLIIVNMKKKNGKWVQITKEVTPNSTIKLK